MRRMLEEVLDVLDRVTFACESPLSGRPSVHDVRRARELLDQAGELRRETRRPAILMLFCEGHPATKGSPALGRNPRTGRAIFVAESQRLRDWTAAVRGQLLAARPRWWPTPAQQLRAARPFGFRVDVDFFLPRPKTVAAGAHPKQDVDKLLRAWMDAATGALWPDDAAVVEARATKAYATSAPGAHVEVRPLYGAMIEDSLDNRPGDGAQRREET